ncbi:MAG: amidohydrolase family protein [Leptospiraceae bacterium]|nr:amidohydrolase family protein [Leptospiraceae bacterium]
MERWQLTNAEVYNAGEFQSMAGLVFSGPTIEEYLQEGEQKDEILSINLHGLAVLPALINGHDSLLASYLPFQGKAPHMNWLSWDNEVKSSPEFQDRMLLDVEDLYKIGAYRNAMNGCSLVVDHIPAFVRQPFAKSLPVDLLEDYGIAHSVGSYALQWGDGVSKEYQRARKAGLPFIIHIAEGWDPESRRSLALLEEFGALGPETVLVHGLSLSDDDLDKIAEAGATVVWCPVSNRFLYDTTLEVERLLARKIPFCLGTDTSMAGGAGMTDNIRRAAELLGKNRSLLPEIVLENPIKMFRLKNRGPLRPGNAADVMVVQSRSKDVEEILTELSPEKVFLVIRGGIPVFGEDSLEPVFRHFGVKFDRIQVGNSRKLIVEGISGLIDSLASVAGRDRVSEILPVSL